MWFFKKSKFVGLISTTFEFFQDIHAAVLTKFAISEGQVWLKQKFCTFEIAENPSF